MQMQSIITLNTPALWAEAHALRAVYHAARDRFLQGLRDKAEDDIQRRLSREADIAFQAADKAHNAALGIRTVRYHGE